MELLYRGASPALACQQLGLALDAYRRTLAADKNLEAGRDDAWMALSENVVSVVYRKAMEGDVRAQALWLRCSPPPGWVRTDSDAGLRDPCQGMSHAQLLEFASARGITLPPAVEAALRHEGR